MDFWTLPRLGREYYTVEIVTTPQLSVWEVSFDQGATWNDMDFDSDTNEATILVSGPDFVPAPGDNVSFVKLTSSVMPYIRANDNPEVIIRTTPKIDLV